VRAQLIAMIDQGMRDADISRRAGLTAGTVRYIRINHVRQQEAEAVTDEAVTMQDVMRLMSGLPK